MALNKYSSRITQVKSQGASQAMLYGTGMTEEDMDRPQVGIASMWFEGNTCNMHLLDLAEKVKEGCTAAGLVGMRFNTIGVRDGISMGTEGMSYSLQSRDLIADSIETVMGAQWYDANISIPGCDKNMPGSILAMGRLNRPALMVYGGTIKPGICQGDKLDIVSAFQSYGEYIAGTLEEEKRKEIVQHACPGRCLRRDVHGEHDCVRHRGDGHVPALQLIDPGRGRRKAGGVFQCRRGDPESDGDGFEAA